jgi:hypothetical protein
VNKIDFQLWVGQTGRYNELMSVRGIGSSPGDRLIALQVWQHRLESQTGLVIYDGWALRSFYESSEIIFGIAFQNSYAVAGRALFIMLYASRFLFATNNVVRC